MKVDALRQGIVELLPRLRRYAYALTGARADADDLLQATVERLLNKGAPQEVNLDKWTFRVCKNIWIDEIRARNVRYLAAASGKVGGDERLDGERVIMDQIAFSEVNDAMRQLPDEQRAALSLIALEGFTYAEAAETLNAPIGTIMSRISRARKALINILGEGTISFNDSDAPARAKP